jgi:hypothetical protein
MQMALPILVCVPTVTRATLRLALCGPHSPLVWIYNRISLVLSPVPFNFPVTPRSPVTAGFGMEDDFAYEDDDLCDSRVINNYF